MRYSHRVIKFRDKALYSAKNALYHAIKPELEVYIGDDGALHGSMTGLLGKCFKGMIDYNFNRTKRLKVIAKKNGAYVYSLYHPPVPSESGKRAIEARMRELAFHLRTPTTNTMAITYKCMCNCVHCSADIKINPNKKELTTEEWKQVIDDCTDLGVYNHVFTGGEPLMRKDLPELIAHVTPEKGTTLIFSNGYLLKERARELADAGLYAINVSIDDVNPEIHNKLRRLDKCFEKAMEGAAAVRELGVLTGISTYATKEKIHNGEIAKLVEMAENEGFVEVTVFDPVPSGKWIHDASCILSKEDKEYLKELTLESRKKPSGPAVIAQSYINSPCGDGCFGGYLQLYTTAYGDVNPCDFNPVSFGNMRNEGGLKKVWDKMIHHPEYRHKRLHCRMQNPEYRKKYIDKIPEGVYWPIPIEYYENDDKEQWTDEIQDHLEQH